LAKEEVVELIELKGFCWWKSVRWRRDAIFFMLCRCRNFCLCKNVVSGFFGFSSKLCFAFFKI